MLSSYYLYLFLIFYIPTHTYTFFFFFFNDTATTEIYTLSLHDALPISRDLGKPSLTPLQLKISILSRNVYKSSPQKFARSEEHTSELQSRSDLVCRLLLEKKKKKNNTHMIS